MKLLAGQVKMTSGVLYGNYGLLGTQVELF